MVYWGPWCKNSPGLSLRQAGRYRDRPLNPKALMPYSDIAIEAGLMLRLAFGRPWRQTEGMLGSIMDLLGLELSVPEPAKGQRSYHTTFSRRNGARPFTGRSERRSRGAAGRSGTGESCVCRQRSSATVRPISSCRGQDSLS